jgi:hypothetical protein
MLSARCLQKNDKASIYNNAEIGKVDGRNVFEEFDNHREHSLPRLAGREGKHRSVRGTQTHNLEFFPAQHPPRKNFVSHPW